MGTIRLKTIKKNRGFYGIILLAICIRSILFFFAIDPIETDSGEYKLLAQAFLESYFFSPSLFLEHTLSRPPGYPFFWWVFGELSNFGINGVLLSQIGLNVLVLIIVNELGTYFFNSTAGLVSMFLLAVDPVTVIFSLKMLSETLFTFTVVLGFWLFWKGVEQSGLFWIFSSGLMLGLSVLIRPISLYLSVVFVLFLAFVKNFSISKRFMIGLIFLFGYLIGPAVWMARNYSLTEAPVVSTKQGDNLLNYRAAGAIAESKDISFRAGRKIARGRAQQYLRSDMSIAEKSRIRSEVGVNIILENTTGYFITASKGFGRIILGPGRASMLELLGYSSPTKVNTIERFMIVGAQVFILTIIYLVVFAGFVHLFLNKKWKPLLILTAIIGYFLVISAGPEAYSRFRVPIIPFIALLAGPAESMLFTSQSK